MVGVTFRFSCECACRRAPASPPSETTKQFDQFPASVPKEASRSLNLVLGKAFAKAFSETGSAGHGKTRTQPEITSGETPAMIT
ncbi:hypothetical protein CSC82_01060 [Rhodobacteraceae bacterium 4F10]|jgi:hypothetical protein|nr:hypothetical protein CSC82_01060 [Rhodobacteraceae bacterium 4F10]